MRSAVRTIGGVDQPSPPSIADSVRLAWPAEAAPISELQRRGWAELPAALAEPLLADVALEDMVEAWGAAITRPPRAHCRVLVAVDQERVTGFATTVPSGDADAEEGVDGEIDEFVVDPAARRRGHGSRLLNACADTLRADGFTRAVCWVAADRRRDARFPDRRRLGHRRRPSRDRRRRRHGAAQAGPDARRPE